MTDSPKRDAITAAALAAFADHGTGGVAVPTIARLAGVGTGTIYRYFASKEALVNAVYREQKLRLRARMWEERNEDDPARARFDAFWARLVRYAREEPDALRFLEMQDHHPLLDDESRALEQQVLSEVIDRMGALRPEHDRDAPARAEVRASMVWGAFVQLFKAERFGLLTLRDDDIDRARDACWAIIVS